MKISDFPRAEGKRPGESVLRILILILVALGMCLLIYQNFWSGTAISRYDGVREYREQSWVLRREGEVLEPELTLPAFRHLDMGKRYSISTTLTYDGNQDRIPCCLFFVDHMYCEAYLDQQLMFRYSREDAEKPDLSRSPGNVYASFQLPRDCLGKELTIVFIPALGDSVEYGLPDPVCGDYFSQAVATFKRDLPQNIVAVLFAFIGLASVLFSLLVLPYPQYKEGLFIGIFSILVSLYSLTESDFDFYVISNPYYTYVLDYTTFTLIPIFLMAFLRERLDACHKKLAMGVILLGCAMFLTEMILHFCGILDMREFLPVIHVVYALSLLLFFVLLLKNKNRKRKKLLIMQICPILLGMAMDSAVYYWHWDFETSDAGFTSIGIFFFMLCELYGVWHRSIEVYTLSERTRDYMNMAYIDALTGIGNRRALEEELNVIASGGRSFQSVILASADLNDLKVVNDTLGHAAGDFLIRSAAEVLAGLTENRCHAFRMGGDEFSVLIYDMEGEEFEYCLQRMQKKIDAINEKSNAKLKLALGYEVVHSTRVQEAIARADKKMYENKARMKKKEA